MVELLIAGGIGLTLGAIAGWIAASQRFARRRAVLEFKLARAREDARTDPLTGLWNRAAFQKYLQTQSAFARRNGTQLSLILIDLDGFKQLNDDRGHQAGDELLVFVAELWRPLMRGSDFLARWGGDEFAVLLPQTDERGAAIVSDRIRAYSSSAKPSITGGAANLAFSAGCATFQSPESLDDLVKRADEALYKAKRLGGNQTCSGTG